MFHKIKEGKAKITVPEEKKISKDLPVFYNPLMEYNRTISIDLLNALNRKSMRIALPLAGTGVRAVRFLKELKKGMIDTIEINDYDPNAIKLIKKNLTDNGIRIKKGSIQLHNKDANIFLAEAKAFDYTDIDPFGSPNTFLNNAILHLKRDAILAVTATDTSALCGTYANVCKRKYWATPSHTSEMHEIGLRILIRKVQLIGMQFEKALIPILSYSKDHYMRAFFIAKKSKSECDKIFKQHNYIKAGEAGPIWTGQLKDNKIVKRLGSDDSFTKTLKEELDILGFYEIPSIYKKEKIGNGKKIPEIMKEIKKQKFKATRTHFSGQGIKSDIPYSKLVEILEK
ncbi:hypothetical protein H6503_02060 [Candidatus Woesearchaeota archaeon]|nr:hypothetical protein [Candidatus Woesearchaeota archaeon]